MDLSRRVVQQRVYDYNEQGLSALEEQRGTPPRPLLTPDQEQVLVARIEAGPRPEDQVCSLRGKDFQRILQVEFGQRRSLPTDRQPTGASIGRTSHATRQSSTSPTRSAASTRRPWRDGRARRDGRSIANGPSGCGAAQPVS